MQFWTTSPPSAIGGGRGAIGSHSVPPELMRLRYAVRPEINVAPMPRTSVQPAPWPPQRHTSLLAVGLGLWLVAMIWNWPVALSFGDEVGYVGQARLFLEGRIRPTADSPGIWHTTPSGGLIAKYPLFHPALLAPFIAVAPRAAFLVGIITAMVLVLCVARVLADWGRDPLWALLVLAQPAITLVSRTMMADLLLSAFLLGAYLAMRGNHLKATVALIAATLLAKPTGPVLAVLLMLGELLTSAGALRARHPAAVNRAVAWGVGMIVGLVAIVGLNLIANGSPWYGYHERFGPPNFGPKFLLTAGAAHAKSLLLAPPLLIVGIWPYWKRRDFGPPVVIVGLVGLMSVYYFVDWGRNWADSLILSQRLVLPAIVFLMIGYVTLLSDALSWLEVKVATVAGWTGISRLMRTTTVAGLLILPGLSGQAIGVRHRRWQEPMRKALAAVTEVAASRRTDRIGLTPNALKYGLLFPGKTTMQTTGGPNPEVILCATKNTSYRVVETDFSCSTPGYESVRQLIGCEILVRSSMVSPR